MDWTDIALLVTPHLNGNSAINAHIHTLLTLVSEHWHHGLARGMKRYAQGHNRQDRQSQGSNLQPSSYKMSSSQLQANHSA